MESRSRVGKVLPWAIVGAFVMLGAGAFWTAVPSRENKPEPAAEEMQGRNAGAVQTGEVKVFAAAPVQAAADPEDFFSPATTDARREELWRAAVSGSNAEKLGLALEILEAPPSAWTERARQLLLLYLGEDLGDDPAVWRSAVESRQAELAEQRGKILEKLEQHRAQMGAEP